MSWERVPPDISDAPGWAYAILLCCALGTLLLTIGLVAYVVYLLVNFL